MIVQRLSRSTVQIWYINVISINCSLVLFLRHTCLLGVVVGVPSGKFITGIHHQALFLGHSSLLHTRSLFGVRTAVTKPEENDNLANQHTKRACGQSSQDTQNGGNYNETEDASNSVLQTTMVEMVHVRRVASVVRRTSSPEGRAFTRSITMVVRMGALVHRARERRFAMAAFASGKSGIHSQHTCFGGGK